ncbi:hypothetical protein P3S68_001358 [Capsicum galapagoense]
MTNNKINKQDTPSKSTSIDEEEGQLELYSPNYALKVNNNNNNNNNNSYQKKAHEEEGQMELYSPEYALKVNNSEVKDEGVKKKKNQKEEVEEKVKKAGDATTDEGSPLAAPLPVRLTSKI